MLTTQPKLDDFTWAYIEAALWATGATDDTTGTEYESLERFCVDDLDPATLALMVADCEKFQAQNATSLRLAADLGDYRNLEYKPAERAGHDFFLTRCGHGVGFWDRDLGRIGERLSKAAEKFGRAFLLRWAHAPRSRLYPLRALSSLVKSICPLGALMPLRALSSLASLARAVAGKTGPHPGL